MHVNAGCVRTERLYAGEQTVTYSRTCISLFTHTKIIRKDILEREHILITYSSAFTQIYTDKERDLNGCLVNKTQMHRREESAYPTPKFASLTPRSRRAESREEDGEAGRGSRGRGGEGKSRGGGTILPHLT
jgi:hypothetical protein